MWPSSEHRGRQKFSHANDVVAAARVIEHSVATPIEQQMSGVDNMINSCIPWKLDGGLGLMRLICGLRDRKTDPHITGYHADAIAPHTSGFAAANDL